MKTHALSADEKLLLKAPQHGKLRVGIGYPNNYFLAMSSLSHLWVHRLACELPDLAIERFYADEEFSGRSFENQTPLGDFDVLAFSLSFELDAVHLLQVLSRAGVNISRQDRTTREPLIIVGGAVASINPLPLSPCVDIFCLGAAELLWPTLLRRILQTPDRNTLLEDLAGLDGFFIPRHHLDSDGEPTGKRRRLEKRDRHFEGGIHSVPASHIVTKNTEYRERGLIEMSRGCPEKCSYCWVSHNYGRLRSYPMDAVMARVREISTMTSRIGFLATAVGDHPKLGEILQKCLSMGLQFALSSLRIPAMRREILEPLAESGARSITIAPETGSDTMRRALRKKVSNEEIYAAVEAAQVSGIEALKMYFILGLPGEEDDDIRSIATLLRNSRDIMLGHEKRRGRISGLHAGISILVPKPYTPYQMEGMIGSKEAKRRIRLLRKELRGASNIRIDIPSHRMALWQCYLSRGGTEAFSALKEAALGTGIASILLKHKTEVELATSPQTKSGLRQFISSAPSARAKG